MIKEYRQIIGTHILHFETGELLAIVSDLIVDPDTGIVEAFWVKPLTVPLSDAIIQSKNIVEFKKHMYIKDDSVIAEAEDVMRIADILRDGRLIVGNHVVGELERKYGRVYDYSFDSTDYKLRQIYCRKMILGFVGVGRLIFSYGLIKEVLEDKIIVSSDPTIKDSVVDVEMDAA